MLRLLCLFDGWMVDFDFEGRLGGGSLLLQSSNRSNSGKVMLNSRDYQSGGKGKSRCVDTYQN